MVAVKSGRSEKETRRGAGMSGCTAEPEENQRQEGEGSLSRLRPPPHRRDKALCGVSLRRGRGHVLPAPCQPSWLPLRECTLLYQTCPRLAPLGYLPGRTSRSTPFASTRLPIFPRINSPRGELPLATTGP